MRLKEWRDWVTRADKPDYLIGRLPWWISRFLGHRAPGTEKRPPQIVRSMSILLVTFIAIVINASILRFAQPFKRWGSPLFVPSFAASAVLLFNATLSPVGQPRHFLIGTFMSSLIGVCLVKLFMTDPNNEKYLWLAGALAAACSSTFMDITATVHPPAGAASVIPVFDAEARRIGWRYLVIVLLSQAIFMGVALLLDNIVLRYPAFWWETKAVAKNVPEKGVDEAGPALIVRGHSFTAPDGMEIDWSTEETIRYLQEKLRLNNPAMNAPP